LISPPELAIITSRRCDASLSYQLRDTTTSTWTAQITVTLGHCSITQLTMPTVVEDLHQ
jgi:hypothetical protein